MYRRGYITVIGESLGYNSDEETWIDLAQREILKS
jgi:hypothetical protein